MSGSAANIVVGPATLSVGGSDVGFTKDGVRLRMEREYVDVAADQVVGIVVKAKSMEKMFVATTLLEATLTNLRTVWDQGAGSGNTLGCNDATEAAVVVVGKGPNGTTRTFSLTKAVSIAAGEINYGRESESAMEAEFECLKDDQGSFGTVVDV